MNGDMTKLVDALEARALAVDPAACAELGEQLAVAPDVVADCARGLRALQLALGEDEQRLDAPPTGLPGDYELRGELGRGGMGVVYRAYQRSLEREVALKVLRPGERMFGPALQRFRREAVSLARLRHPHIVSVHEVGEADGQVFFTMDFVDGRTLAEVIGRRGMPITQALRLVQQVCSAMSYAHGQGVVHRDLKPQNILVAEDRPGERNAFVVDFGLARDLGAAAGYTVSGQLLGTPGYMSPEQALGQGDRVGERSDVYALGVILYECLCGNAPFAELPLVHMLHAVVERAPRPLHELNKNVPRELSAICHKAMAKDPAKRYATMQAFAQELQRFASGEPTHTRSPSRWRSWLRAQMAPGLLVVAILCVVLVPMLLWQISLKKEKSVPRDLLTYKAGQHFAAGDYDGAAALYGEALRGRPASSLRIAVQLAAAAGDRITRLELAGEWQPGRFADAVRQTRQVLSPWLRDGSRSVHDDDGVVPDGEDWLSRARVVDLQLAAWGSEQLPEVPSDLAPDAWTWPDRAFVRRNALALLLRAPAHGIVEQCPPGLDHELLLEALDRFAVLPECVRADFVAGVESEQSLLVDTTSRAYERALCEHMEKGSPEVATLAARLLDQVSDVALHELPAGDPAASLQVVAEYAALWRRLDAMSTSERRREVVLQLVRALQQRRFAGNGVRQSRAWNLVWCATGCNLHEFDAWWLTHADQPPLRWVLERLGIDYDESLQEPASALARWRFHREHDGKGKSTAADGHYVAWLAMVLPPEVERSIRIWPGAEIADWYATVR